MRNFLRRRPAADEPAELPRAGGPARPVAAVVDAERRGVTVQFLPAGRGGRGPSGEPEDTGAGWAIHHLSVTGPTWVRPGDLEDPDPVGLHGVAELTILLQGELEHRDGLGNRMLVQSPAALLVAGGGGLLSETAPSRGLRRDGGDLHTIVIRWLQQETGVPTMRRAEAPTTRRQGRSTITAWCGPDAPLDQGGVTLAIVEVSLGGVVDLEVGPGPAAVAVLRGRVLVGEELQEVAAGTLVRLGAGGTRLQLATHLGDEHAPLVLVMTAPTAPPVVTDRAGLIAAADDDAVAAAQEGMRDGSFGTLPRLDG